LALVLDLGQQALAGAFLTQAQFGAEERYPLRLCFCQHCFLLQVIDVVPPEELFSRYFYRSSAIGTLREHFENLAAEVAEHWANEPTSLVVEIGSNDGVLLEPLARRGVRAIGVEPAVNLAETARQKGLQVENHFFTSQTASDLKRRHGCARVIMANNVFAHLDEMYDVVLGIADLLDPDGVFITENHYIGSVIDDYQYDMVYHEHLSYYSLLTLERFLSGFNLAVVDVRPIAIHAGSMRYYIRSAGQPVSRAVHELREEEISKGYNRLVTFAAYAERIADRRRDLISLLQSIASSNQTVAGYGASGRANTIIQYCGIDHGLMKYMIDDAPSKQGYYTPGSHFLIRPREAMKTDKPDYLLLFAWAFVDEVRRRNREFLVDGGRIIVPLPYPHVLA
jgi:SAM-dependent methyltransferase